MRKTKSVTITADGRDKGKTFLLTELPAVKAEKWATRALLAIGQSGVTISEDALTAGMAGLAVVGIRALMSVAFEEAEPLLDEMRDCIQIQPDPRNASVVRPVMWDDEIEEVGTILLLRDEVMQLHLGFSIRETLSKLAASRTVQPESGNTQTSPEPSAPSSLPDSQPSPS